MRRTLHALLLLAGTLACDDAFLDPDEVTRAELRFGGGTPRGTVGDTLQTVVVARDGDTGRPIRGLRMGFEPESIFVGFDPIAIEPLASETDAHGRLAVRVRLGTRAGVQRVRASLMNGPAGIGILATDTIRPGELAALSPRLVVREPPFVPFLAEAPTWTTLVTFAPLDRFGNRTNIVASVVGCISSNEAVFRAEQRSSTSTSDPSCILTSVARGTAEFVATASTAVFRSSITVLPWEVRVTIPFPGAVLAVYSSPSRALALRAEERLLIPPDTGERYVGQVRRYTEPGVTQLDGLTMMVGGLWLSPSGVAWAVGMADDFGKVQTSPSSGVWEPVALPSSMNGWTARRVYGFGSSFLLLAATRGAAPNFTLWAKNGSGAWTNLEFPASINIRPFVAVESPVSLYVADSSTNRSWHWNGSSWRPIRLNGATGPEIPLAIITAAPDGTVYGRSRLDSATTSYRLRDGVATRHPWPHHVADYNGRAIRFAPLEATDPLVRSVPLVAGYRLGVPPLCPMSETEFAELSGIYPVDDGRIRLVAVWNAFAGQTTGNCRSMSYIPR